MASLEDLMVRLIGDTTQYQESMRVAAQVTAATGETITGLLNGALAGYTAEALAAEGGTDRLAAQVQNLNRRLAEQAETFGMTNRQAQIHIMAMRGAGEGQLAVARVADARLTQLEQEALAQKMVEQTEANRVKATMEAAAAQTKAKEQQAALEEQIQQKALKANMDNLVADHRERKNAEAQVAKAQEEVQQRALKANMDNLAAEHRARKDAEAQVARTEEQVQQKALKANMDNLAAEHRERKEAEEKRLADAGRQAVEMQRATESLDSKKSRALEAQGRAQERAEQARIRAAEQAEQAENRRIQRQIQLETERAKAAARTYNAQQDIARQRAISEGTQTIGGAVSFAIGIGKSTLSDFADFDLAMTRSTSIMKVTQEEMTAMRETALSLSKSFAFSATEFGQAFYFLASSGMNAEQAMAAMPAVARFATAGAMDLGHAAHYAVAATSALGLASKDAQQNMMNMTRVMDMVTKASKISLGTTEQYAKGLTRDAAAAMKAYHIELSQGIALLATYNKAGLQGAIAGNTMGRAIRLMAGSTAIAGAAQRELGFHVYDATGKMRNMADIVQNLEEILAKHTEEAAPLVLKRLGFETLAQKSITPLLGQSQMIRDFQSQIAAASGTTESISAKQMKAFSNQMTIVGNQAKAAAIALGSELAPTIMMVARGIGSLMDGWSALPDVVRRTTAVILQLTVGFAGLFYAILKLPVLINAVTTAFWALNTAMYANPAIAVAAAVAAIVIFGPRLISVIIGWTGSFNELNDEMERNAELNLKINAATAAANAARIKATSEIEDPVKRKETASAQFKTAQTDAKTYADRLKKLKAELAGVGGGQAFLEWFGTIPTGEDTTREKLRKDIEDITTKMKNAEAAAKGFKDIIDKIKIPTPAELISAATEQTTQEIEKVNSATAKIPFGGEVSKALELMERGADITKLLEAISFQKKIHESTEAQKEFNKAMKTANDHLMAHKNGIGDTAREVEFYTMVRKGATQAELTDAKTKFERLDAFEKQEKLMKEGIKVTKDNLTPAEKFNEAQFHLNELLNTIDPSTKKAAISQETYNKAIAKAAQQFYGAAHAAQTFNAAAFGSAEAITRLEHQRDALETLKLPSFGAESLIPEPTPQYNIPKNAPLFRLPIISGLLGPDVFDKVKNATFTALGKVAIDDKGKETTFGQVISLLTKIADAAMKTADKPGVTGAET